MKETLVNIDFKVMAKALKEFVRKNAVLSDNTIVYIKSGQVVEENPKTFQTRILKRDHGV
ncbi:MAG: hypothetical protein ABI855_00805 [Bacteroidota bacterium]